MDQEKKYILIVDDSLTLRRIVREALSVLDFTILEADGSAAALVHLEQHQVELMVLDWHMPGVDGFELFVHLQAQVEYKDIPVIMLSAEDRKESMLKAIRAGIRHYLTKPFTHEDLLARVVAVLRLDQQ